MVFLWLLSCFAFVRVSFGFGAPASYSELTIVPRIINGKDARPGSWPWLVSLQTPTGIHLCGGSLINQNWVITAAHCNITPSDIVVADQFDRHSLKDNIQTLRIAQIFLHPQFNPSTHFADIALLKLASPSHFYHTVHPVFLPNVDDKFHLKSSCKIVGWGLTHPNGSRRPDRLQQATVPLMTYEKCRKFWGSRITSDMICAGANGVGSYHGDSGGPLVCMKKGVWTLVGIMVCASNSYPTLRPVVAIRFPKYKPWVEYTVAHN